MTSKARSQNTFLDPEVPSKNAIQEDTTIKGRQATVYDAVAGQRIRIHSVTSSTDYQAGRLNASGFIPKQAFISSSRDTASSSATAVPPEAVLFRRKNAPTRYEESDIYFANERELRTELPESDLLKALHCYASDFYSRTTTDSGMGDYRSMDETALIALGILMEEATRDILGQSGDLVFTEGEEVQVSPRTKVGDACSSSSRVKHSTKRRRILENQDESNINNDP